MITPKSNPASLFSSLGFLSPPPAKPGVLSILVISRDEDSVTLRRECLATIAWGGPLQNGLARAVDDVWEWLVHGGGCNGSSFSGNGLDVHIISREDDDPIFAIGIEAGGYESWIATRQKDVAAQMVLRLFEAIASGKPVNRQPISAYHARPSES